jgi:hypothetical protein
MTKLATFLLALFLLLPQVRADDLVDNPSYKGWSSFAVGSFVKYRTVITADGNSTETILTFTLMELTDEKAVVELKFVTKVAGSEFAMPPVVEEYPAKVPESDTGYDLKPEETEEGDETIEALGSSLDCHWVRTVHLISGIKTTTQSWMSDEVPGRLVRKTSRSEGTYSYSTEMMLIEIHKD